MDILLTHGYFLYEDAHELAVMKPYPPLGILYISAHLKEKGFDVSIFDSTFLTLDEFTRTLEENTPPVVGIYCNLMTRSRVLRMIELSKANGAIVILGGPEPINYAEEYLRAGADVIVEGEGELTLAALLPHLQKSGLNGLDEIQGIIFQRDDGTIVRADPRPQIQDLDAEPFPDRAAIDIPRYVDVWRKHHGTGSVSLITARGCPYKCQWCSHSVFGYTHRRRSPQNVADELALILDTYRPDIVWYADDVFTINHRWLNAYQSELKQRGLHAPFETISREDRLDEDVIRTLADMGCFRLWIGSESGSQEILNRMKRQTDAERVREMTHLLRKYGIQSGMFIMLGYEGEDIGDLEETLDLLKQANPDVFLTTVAYPIKGTPYYDQVSDRLISRKAWEEGSDRDLTVAGRRSQRFYRYANRWLVSEVGFHKARQNGGASPLTLVKRYTSARLGQMGMILTQNERD